MAPPTRQALIEAIGRFGFNPTAVRLIRSGHVNKHWRVETAGGAYVLRRYQLERSPAAIEYEHATLEHAFERAWPVARPVAARSGRSTIELSGHSYALFPRLAGRRVPYERPDRTRATGAMLARFHHDMASWDAPGQRDGFGRLWELDIFVQAMTDFGTFDGLLRAFERDHRDLARAIRAERHTNLRELSRLGYAEVPATLIHADFHHDNLLLQRGRLSGLLDFDFVRLDARVADIAMTVALDCAAPPAYNELQPASVQAFVAGYAGASPLTEAELRLVLPLVRAYFLWLTTYRLCERTVGESDRALRSVHRSLDVRLPRLRHRWSELENAIGRGAESGAATPAVRRGHGTR